MSTISDILAQSQPLFQTNQALLVIGLQNDFISPDGKLPCRSQADFVDRIKRLVPVFRENAGDVIWFQTVYEEERAVNDPSSEGDIVILDGSEPPHSDGEENGEEFATAMAATTSPGRSRTHTSTKRALELLKRVSARKKTPSREVLPPPPAVEEEDELFLSRTSRRGPCGMARSWGADFADDIKDCIDRETDIIVVKSFYSAFHSTSLLLTLRAKLITELYICGCMTNISVFATALDAARHGLTLNLVEDCLGFRKASRHEEAMRQMTEIMGAYTVTSDELLGDLLDDVDEDGTQVSQQSVDTRDIENMVQKLSIRDAEVVKGAKPTDVSQGLSKRSSNIERSQKETEEREDERRAGGPAGGTKDRTPEVRNRKSSKQLLQQLKGVSSPRSGSYDHGTPQVTADEQLQETPTKTVRTKKSRIRMRVRVEKEKKLEDSKGAGSPAAPAFEASAAGAFGAKAATSHNQKHGVAEPRPSEYANAGKNVNKQHKMAAESHPKEGQKPKTPSSRSSAQPIPTSNPPPPSREPPAPPQPRKRTPKRSSSENILKRASRELFSSSKSFSSPNPKSHSPEKYRPPPISPTPKTPPLKLLATQSPTKKPSDGHKTTGASSMGKKVQNLATLPTLGPNDVIAEGDTHIVHDLFPSTERCPGTGKVLKDEIFHLLLNEVRWQEMFHAQGEVPRLVAHQGVFADDGSMPCYRHPSDQALPLMRFTPAVELIRKQVEQRSGQPVNHALIQLYRSGQDFITEHSDKTLDIARGSKIINVSFGAQRTMRLRTKKSAKEDSTSSRNTQRVPMPHNSMFVMGPETNMRWLHGIQPDKRPEEEKSAAERAFGGMRISLTFRQIETFLDANSRLIWGQGATGKTRGDAKEVINGDEARTTEMIKAFSKENHETEFDWDAVYGAGSDVLHFTKPLDEEIMFFTGSSLAENAQVSIALNAMRIPFISAAARLDVPSLSEHSVENEPYIRDVDRHHTEVSGALNILLYLDRFYNFNKGEDANPIAAAAYPLLLKSHELLKEWRECGGVAGEVIDDVPATLTAKLGDLENAMVDGEGYIAGKGFSIADCAVWPVVAEILESWDMWTRERFPKLSAYYKWLWKNEKSVGQKRRRLVMID